MLVLRSSFGNLSSVLKQLTAHKRQLGSILHTGMARGHHGNPTASLRVLIIYDLLMSALGALVLNKSEKDKVNQHYNATLESLMRLQSPHQHVLFISCLTHYLALVHLRQQGLLGIVTRLQGSNECL